MTLVGGLAPDNEEPMEDTMREFLQETWRRIQQQIPGTEFNFDFWTSNTPRRSTYPACRAVIAARQLADEEEQMTYGIQQAYYLHARNPSDLDTLVDIASSLGINPGQFRVVMESEEIQQSLNSELSRVRSIGIQSFPSLLIQQHSRQQVIPLNYRTAAPMLQEIHHFIFKGKH